MAFQCGCNLQCFYCYERAKRTFQEFESLESVVHKLEIARDCGYDVLAFASGELLLHPQHRELLARAVALGFHEIQLVTNLTLIDEAAAATLRKAGVGVVAGTLMAGDDQGGMAAAAGREIWTRQLRAVRALAAEGVEFVPHFLLTASVAKSLLSRFDEVREAVGRPLPDVIVSAIQPIQEEHKNHPEYVPADVICWPELVLEFSQRSARLVTQNVPVCRLGDFAHRNWRFQRRVARFAAGLPSRTDQLALIAEQENLLGGTELGTQAVCHHPVLCQNTQGLTCTRTHGAGFEPAPTEALRDSVARLLQEWNVPFDALRLDQIAERLHRFGSSKDLAEALARQED
jgi:uncharacterized Fe-S cluster-containing radical SAM superfamily protein